VTFHRRNLEQNTVIPQHQTNRPIVNITICVQFSFVTELWRVYKGIQKGSNHQRFAPSPRFLIVITLTNVFERTLKSFSVQIGVLFLPDCRKKIACFPLIYLLRSQISVLYILGKYRTTSLIILNSVVHLGRVLYFPLNNVNLCFIIWYSRMSCSIVCYSDIFDG
jgi:hypothetical protein